MRRKSWKVQLGQGLVEYVLLTALVVVTAVALFKVFREDLQKAYQKAGQTLINSVSEDVSAGPASYDQ